MTAKKLHEVEAMSEIVSRIAAATNASHVIDIGSGKGYLSSVLVLQHHFKVLGIDCNHVNTHGAADRTVKFEVRIHVGYLNFYDQMKCNSIIFNIKRINTFILFFFMPVYNVILLFFRLKF